MLKIKTIKAEEVFSKYKYFFDKNFIMDYRDRVFMAVAGCQSFSKAAKELFISQPAVTKHIKELEFKLNITLFDRKSNKIYLTKAGKLTYNYLKKIKQQYDELEFELGKLSDFFKGELRIGASSTISQYLLPQVLADFHKMYQDIKLYLYSGNSFEVEQMLINDKVDIAFVENHTSLQDIQYSDFLDDEIVVVTGANSIYAKNNFITIQDFYELPLVLREKGSGTLEVIKNSLKENNIDFDKLNVFLYLGSTETIKNFLLNFDGIALVSERSIKNELQLKTLKILRVKNLLIMRKFRIGIKYGVELKLPKLITKLILANNY